MPDSMSVFQVKASAAMTELLRGGKMLNNKMRQEAYAQMFGQGALELRLQLEALYPSKFNGKFMFEKQLDDAVPEIMAVLHRYAGRARRLLEKPIAQWETKPIIHSGIEGQPNLTPGAKRSARFSLLSGAAKEVATGAFITAVDYHTKPAAQTEEEKIQHTRNDAAWHFIWANNGVTGKTVSINRRAKTGSGRPGALKFRVPYNAATTPGTLQGGKHTEGDAVVFKSAPAANRFTGASSRLGGARVTSRGIAPRNFVGLAADVLRPTFAMDVLIALKTSLAKTPAKRGKVTFTEM